MRNLRRGVDYASLKKALEVYGKVKELDLKHYKVTFATKQGAINAFRFCIFDATLNNFFASPYLELSKWNDNKQSYNHKNMSPQSNSWAKLEYQDSHSNGSITDSSSLTDTEEENH